MKFIAFFFLLLLFPVLSFSQKTTQIELINANTLEYNKKLGEDVKRLIGSVVLKHDSTYLYCDSAYLHSESNSVDAFGHVRINSGTVVITGEVLNYDGDSRDAVLHRKVTMNDGNMTLTTEHLTYNTRTDIGNYTTGGKIVDPENVLTSTIGYYYAEKKQMFFKKNVVLVNPKYTVRSDTMVYYTETEVSHFYGPTTIVSKENFIYCENGWYDSKNDIAQFNKNAYFKNKEQKLSGDSLYYDRKKGFGQAFNNITAIDTTQKITIKGDYGEYREKEGITLVTKKAELIQTIDKDSLFLHADTLKSFTDTAGVGKRLYAYHHAKFFKTDLQGAADSIYYSFKDSVIYMYTHPMLWTDKNQLSGDTILIQLSHNQIKQMNLYSSSFIISRDDDSLRFNQVKGKNLVGHFVNNELNRIDVYGNGETVYYVRDDKTKLIGINKATAQNLLIYVKDKAIKTITFLSKPEANLYPEKDLSLNDVRLKDFKWEETNRPEDRYDIFH
jgi:lipopolysaccharide export system protein LptA